MIDTTRDKATRDEILEELERIWSKYPDLRFCQIIDNCFDLDEDLYYITDEEFLIKLKGTYYHI